MIQRLYHDTTPSDQASLFCHDTKLCIVTLTPSQDARARCRSYCAFLSAVSQYCSAVSWAWLAVSWPSPLHPGQPVVLPCVTIQKLYRDSNWEKGVVAHPVSFLQPFFFHSNYWKITKKIYILYIFFIFQYNQINLLKFIFFIFFLQVLHIVKP